MRRYGWAVTAWLAGAALWASVGVSETWKSEAVIYGITPYHFAEHQPLPAFRAIEARIPELAELGVNVLWLQPVYVPATPGHGYDVVDFKKVWPELGTEAELRSLIHTAHQWDMKVLFDIPVNHTPPSHPYARDVIARGKDSPYYDFYMHELKPGVPYSEHLKIIELGGTPFVYYFWEHLINLNFDHPEARRFAIDVSKYWIANFDIDGYRFDASWAPHSRWPEFYQVMSRELRAVKPDILLLAEDKAPYGEALRKAGYPSVFEGGFDLAYDWTRESGWISHWTMQVGSEHDQTVFNRVPERQRAQALRRALSESEGLPAEDPRVLRFLENNDTTSFLGAHTRAQTRMAAALMFALPGVPMIFYGQEVGIRRPRLWQMAEFEVGKSIASYDPELWTFYRRLIALRKASPALQRGSYRELPFRASRASGAVLVFARQAEAQNLLVLVNQGSQSTKVTVSLPEDLSPSPRLRPRFNSAGVSCTQSYARLSRPRPGGRTVKVPLAPHSTQILEL